MSLWRPKAGAARPPLVLGLSAQRLAWASSVPQARSPSIVTAAHGDVTQAFGNALRGSHVDVVAGNDIALHWLQTPPSSVSSFDELQLVASARCAHLYGGTPQDWWVTGDWSVSHPFVCAALPRSVVASLQEQLRKLGLGARWHTAWGLVCSLSAGAFPSEGWSAMRSPDRVMLWHCRAGRVNRLATLAVDQHAVWPAPARLALQHMQVEASRGGALLSGPLHWLHLGNTQESQNAPGIHPVIVKLPEAMASIRCEASSAMGLGALLAGGH